MIWTSRCRLAAATLVATALVGCSSVGGFTGAVAGVATGTFTTNPAVGVAVGVTVKAATDAEMNRVFRDMQTEEQIQIAELAGGLETGDRRPWRVHHLFSYGDERGDVQVLSTIDNALASCKEVLFSVARTENGVVNYSWFVTQTCKQSDGRWRWAAAEPATQRWGTLQ